MTVDALPAIKHAFGCSSGLAEVISARASYRHYPARGSLISSGETVNTAFLLVDGRAREFAISIDGRMIVVQEFMPGDLFGEGVILGEMRATEDIVAILPCDAGLFEANALIGLIENYSCVALAFSKLMTQRLRQTRRRLVEGTTLSAAGRIYSEILRQARASSNNVIKPAPVLSEFALLVQSTRETVSRAISTLEKRGIIERTPEHLRVIAPHRLEELIV